MESVPLKGNALSSGFTLGILFPDDLWVLKWHVDFFVVLVWTLFQNLILKEFSSHFILN